MRNTHGRKITAVAFVLFASVCFLHAVDISDTKMLTKPTISATHVAFVYANDVWVADLDGKNVRHLTTDLGIESDPAFSPDGTQIAFSGQYEGNTDVYLVPTAGGIPKRLTWHPAADIVQGFTPDGKAILYSSAGASYVAGYSHLYSVSLAGGFPSQLKVPNAFRATLSPDGTKLAYNPLPDAFAQWKNYRGGRNSVIWILRLSDNTFEKVPQPESRSNDPGPMWIGDKIYFRSDRNGEFNLYSYDPKTKIVKQITAYENYPILSASAGGGRIIFEQAGTIHVYDPQAGTTKRLVIGVSADLNELRERYVRGSRWARNADLSPSGARAVFEFRGEIVTVPSEKGDPRLLTDTPGTHERLPVWSPDGRSLAYVSDASGEYELHIRAQDGKSAAKAYKLTGAGFFDALVWSPDSQKISFGDNSRTLYWIDLKTAAQKKIAWDCQLSLRSSNTTSWSPDSKWIAYVLNSATYIQKIYVYSLDQDKSFPITDGLSDASEPVFDATGKYLYFFSSTDAGPVKQWFDLSNADIRFTSSIYVAALTNTAPNPLARESDEEKGTPEKPATNKSATKSDPAKDDEAGTARAKPGEEFKIDFDGLSRRILALPVAAGEYRSLSAGEAGQIFYLENAPNVGSSAIRGAMLHKFDFKTRKDEVIINSIARYKLSADKKKVLYISAGAAFIAAVVPKPQPGQGRLAIDAIEVKINPISEWKQIFDEAWRINRDYFYAPNMHGVDWPAMKKKYEIFLPHLSCRNDLNRVIQWMCSELGVSHHRVEGGDSPNIPKIVSGGLLGADYVIENGRYAFKKVYGGLNWNSDLRSPLTELGVDVRAGEYLLAVNGKDLRPPADLYAMFESTAGKLVEITVGPNPDGTGARTFQVVPIESESNLRNRDWIESNLRKVEQATGGRVAYVYVPNTATLGLTYFKRYYYPQADKDAIIVDERFNSGGLMPDYYIDHLRQPLIGYWNSRYGTDFKLPSASIQGPKVLIANEMSGSGGEMFPWMWRKFKLGPIIGKRTWGGEVGTLGYPVLMDGGSVTAPNLASWAEEDGWLVENIGVSPDIEVEQIPSDVIAGRDPQLEKAIQVVMDELKKNPPKKPQRPPYPIHIK